MIKRILSAGLLAMVIGLVPAVVPVQAESGKAIVNLTTVESATRARRFGPYATLRRANEVANYARRHGYNAKVIYGGSFYDGTRAYYVDVWE